MDEKTFLSIRKKYTKLIKRYGIVKAADKLINILDRINIDVMNYLRYSTEKNMEINDM